MKRVMHLIDSAGVYGAERVILNLSTEMLHAGLYHPVVGCIVKHAGDPCDLVDVATKHGLEVAIVEIDNGRLLHDLPRAARLFRSMDIDLVHTHGYKPVVFAYAIRVIAGIPTFSTSHLWATPSEYPLRTKLMVWISERLYARFPFAVAVSEPVGEALAVRGVPRDRIRVIPNGVDINDMSADDSQIGDLKRELGVSAGEFCILNAGRLTRQKSQWVIVEAAAILKNAGIRCRFFIVGQGELENDLRRLIRERDVTDTVHLLGFRSDIKVLLGMADVFVLPSLYEGMPISLLEAVAARVPVVATPVGDVPRLIVNGDSGVVIQPEDGVALAEALMALHADPDIGHRLVDSAFVRMENEHSAVAMYGRYAEIYGRMLDSTGM